MEEHIISPDGKFMLVDSEWIPLPGHELSIKDSAIAGDVSIQSNVNINLKSNTGKQIRNLAEICIEKIQKTDMKSASEMYTEAKKIDHAIAKTIFEDEYSVKIGIAYADLLENYLVDVIKNEISHNIDYTYSFESHNVEGHHKASALLDLIEISFNNAIFFLGNPDEITIGDFDIDWGGVCDEFGTINTEAEQFSDLIGLEFVKHPTEEAVKQKYRIGIALELSALSILNDLIHITQFELPHGDVNHNFIDTDKPAELFDSASLYTKKIVAIAVHEGFDIKSWTEEYDTKLGALRTEQIRFREQAKKMSEKLKEMVRKLELQEKMLQTIREGQYNRARNSYQSSDCFIATAAYGTNYENKINVLRCWRDVTLLKSRRFTPLVKYYYKTSPPIARFLSKSPFLRFIVRLMLTPIIVVVGYAVRNRISTWKDNGNPV